MRYLHWKCAKKNTYVFGLLMLYELQLGTGKVINSLHVTAQPLEYVFLFLTGEPCNSA